MGRQLDGLGGGGLDLEQDDVAHHEDAADGEHDAAVHRHRVPAVDARVVVPDTVQHPRAVPSNITPLHALFPQVQLCHF